MRKNLLPNMQPMQLTDRDGMVFTVQIEVRKREDQYFVFLSDTHQLGGSRIAQDAMYCFGEIRKQLKLEARKTVFYRHIYQQNMGSLFGRFDMKWGDSSPTTYKFQMLTNIDDLQSVKNLLRDSEAVYGAVADEPAVAMA